MYIIKRRQYMRRKKLIVILLAIMLGFPIIAIGEYYTTTAEQNPPPEENQLIDLNLVHSVAENLSNVINNPIVYLPSELAKGRAFGSKGENYAAEQILKIRMQDIGLDNPPGLYSPYLEQIGIPYNSSLTALNKSMTITNISSNPPNVSPVDCFISPRWSREGGWFIGIELPRLFKDLLTYNFNYTDLKVWHEPREFDISINDFFNATFEDIMQHFNITNSTIFDDYISSRFEEYYDFSFDDIVDHPENAIDKPFYNATFFNCSIDPFVFIREDTLNNPNYARYPRIQNFDNIMNGFLQLFGFSGDLNGNRASVSLILYIFKLRKENLRMRLLRCLPNCKGEIRYDYTGDSHDEVTNMHVRLPVIYINGSVGRNISKNVANYQVDFSLNQFWDDSVTSYNVIGQIEGADTSKKIVINSLYDCWFNQGTADSAIACGIVLALAKKYKELDEAGIHPKHTLKFVLFSGEEYGQIGVKYYKEDNNNEDIETFIDLNQLGFTQPTPRLTFDIGTNRILLKPLLNQMGMDTNYIDKTNNVANFSALYTPFGMLSDDIVFAKPLLGPDTITFLKDTGWFRHHRDGVNHTKGDVMDYYDPTDVEATASLIFNCSKYFCINPNCSFAGPMTYTTKDSPNDDDTLVDTVEVNVPLQSILSSDLVRVKAELKKHWWSPAAATVEKDFVIGTSVSHHTIDITLLPYEDPGKYYVYLYLYNSTGRLNLIVFPDILVQPNETNVSDDWYYLYPRGNDAPETPDQPNGPTSLQVGERGAWGADTYDQNDDLVGEFWYLWSNEHPLWFKDSGLYDANSVTKLMYHAYWDDGTYQIKVRAYDEFFSWLHPFRAISGPSDDLEVTVSPNAGIILQQQLHQDVIHALPGQTLYLSGAQVGGQSVQWLWNFGDQTRCSTERNSTHSYSSTAIYNVTLSVTDTETSITGTTYVHVRVTDLDSDFNMSYFHGAPPNTPISFHSTSKGLNQITNCTWDFDDGTISYDSNVNHTFIQDGDYNVTLTVKDNQNHTDTDYCVLHITSNPRPPEIPYVQSPGTIHNASDATILAEVDATDRNLTNVTIQITTPNGTTGNYTMTNLVDDVYLFTLNNSSQNGQYNFTIIATDSENNTNSTSGSYVMSLPFLYYEPPTPANNAYVNHPWVKVNVTVVDPFNTSAYIDWNRSLKGYWPMDTYDTTWIYDNSTYQNYGRFHNGINASNITTGKYGKGLMFDGNDDYVDVGNDTSLNLGTGNFTFMVWEKSHATSYANTTVILSNQPENANWAGYVFGVKNTPFFYTAENGQFTSLNGSHDVTDSAWHHLAYVRKGSNLSLYVDGAFDAGKTGTLRNITNNQSTCFSNENRTDCCHFDGVLDEAQLFGRALSREEINASYNNGLYRLYHNFTGLADGSYLYYAHAIDTTGNQSTTEAQYVTIDTVKPTITAVSDTPDTVGFGYNVTIQANATDNLSGISAVHAVIHYPSYGGILLPINVTLTHLTNNTYQYIFNDTAFAGRYNYSICAIDNATNSRTKTGYSFNVSANATINISTLADTYQGSQYINLTDPPSSPDNYTLVGRGLTWNKYYNASSGDNVLEIYQEPINYQNETSEWTPINCTFSDLVAAHPAYAYGYRTGNEQGLFNIYLKPNIQSSWPVAFTYNKSENPTTHVVRTALLGVGYLDPSQNWAHVVLQNVQSSQGQRYENSVTYPNALTGTNVTYTYSNTKLKEDVVLSNTTKSLLQAHPPSSYGLSENSYLVFVTKVDCLNLNMYNGSGMLTGNATISEGCIDFKDALGLVKCSLPLGEAYELNNHENTTLLTYRIVRQGGEWYLLSGLRVTTLNSMTFPVVIDPTIALYSSSDDGFLYNYSTNYNSAWINANGFINNSDTSITIGQKKQSGMPSSTYYIYRGFLFFNTSSLTANSFIQNATLSLYKCSDYSATDFLITVQNGQPTYPHSRLTTTDYNKAHYSGNGGALNTNVFGNGYNNIYLNSSGRSWINRTGWTKLCLRSNRDISGTTPTGNEYVSVTSNEFLGFGCQPKLTITYRNHSKLRNSGSTTIRGYLLIQVQFYNASQGKWILDSDTVNETSPRTLNPGERIGLDTIFNGKIRASNLQHGAGTYRVYTAFRDRDGDVLTCLQGRTLAAYYEFTKT